MNLLEHYKQYNDSFLIADHPKYGLHLVKYLHAGIDWSIPHALEARGIVLDDDGQVIARPYPKFFNLNQLSDYDEDGNCVRRDLPEEILKLDQWEDEPFIVTEKIDGSLIIVFEYKGEIIFASSGSFISEHALFAKELFYAQFGYTQMIEIKEKLSEGFTFLFELISPKFQIILDYPADKLILHGIINTQTGEEDFKETSEFAKENDIDFIEVYNYTIDEMLEIQKTNKDIEGFVIRFESGKFLKIKTDDYFIKSYDSQFYFGKMYTKSKLMTISKEILNDKWDDLILGAENRKNVQGQLSEVKMFIEDLKERLRGYKNKWLSGEYADPKIIATDPIFKDIKHDIFLSRREESSWDEYITRAVIAKFMEERK